MCLIVVALHAAPAFPLIVAANRDEQHTRPTQRAAWWPDRPDVLAGRDLKAGGTWLAVDRRGRLAAVTNVRDGQRRDMPRSRGGLVTEFVGGNAAASLYSQTVAADSADFGAFNLVVFDGNALHYASNRAPAARLDAGVHALSNAPRDTEWPKVVSARAGAIALLAEPEPLEGLFVLLAERGTATREEERYFHAHFIVGEHYGTRCSTVLLVDAAGRATFAERSFDAAGRLTGEVRETFALRRTV